MARAEKNQRISETRPDCQGDRGINVELHVNTDFLIKNPSERLTRSFEVLTRPSTDQNQLLLTLYALATKSHGQTRGRASLHSAGYAFGELYPCIIGVGLCHLE